MHTAGPETNWLGLNKESSGLREPGDSIIYLAAILHKHIRSMEVYGRLPSAGPALVVSNHVSEMDPLAIAYLGILSDRRVRPVVRHNLTDPEAREKPGILERTGKREPSNSFLAKYVRRIRAAIIRGVDPIPFHRGENDGEAFRKINDALKNGEIVGIFAQETRNPREGLEAVMRGPGFIAIRNPDVPVYVVALINTYIDFKDLRRRPRVIVGESFTFNDLRNKGVAKNTKEVREEIKRRLSKLLSSKS